MGERYSDDELNAWLDELLCEYVDGAMDPSVRGAFEEFLVANPDVAKQAGAMVEARRLLCSCRVHAPSGIQQRIRSVVNGEYLGEQEPARLGHGIAKLAGALGVVAGLTIFLLVGVWLGHRLPLIGPSDTATTFDTGPSAQGPSIVDGSRTPPLEQLVVEPAQRQQTPFNALMLDPIAARPGVASLGYDRRLSIPISDSAFTAAVLITP